MERIRGNGLAVNVHRFVDASVEQRGTTVVLLHGLMDAAGTWTRVAERLAGSGLSVVAPDFRGFGDSDWVSGGGYYHFPDYVADTAAVIDALDPAELVVVGHSMGATVACLYTGATGRPKKLVLLEGVGAPEGDPALGPARMRAWLAHLRKAAGHPAGRKHKPIASLDEAAERLAVTHPNIAPEVLRSVAPYLVRERDGALVWAFDPLHRSTAPSLFRVETFGAFLAAITCPVLFVSGGTSGWHLPDERARLGLFPSHPREIVLEGAGHMMHWTRPDAVADAIAAFIEVPT